jgi:hypothetical protein
MRAGAEDGDEAPMARFSIVVVSGKTLRNVFPTTVASRSAYKSQPFAKRFV